MARIVAFAFVVVSIGLGYYAYTLSNELDAARQSAWDKTHEAEACQAKSDAAEKKAADSASALQTCQQSATDLKTQLDAAQAAMAKHHK